MRPLHDDGAQSATAATRDYTLKVDTNGGAPMLNIFGGKITTYRRLAETALVQIGEQLGATDPWTAGVALPGGDFPVDGFAREVAKLKEAYGFLTDRWATRLVRAYGTDAPVLLGEAKTASDLGQDFGATLTEVEVRWLMDHEFARHAEDVVWRRSKLGLRLSQNEIASIEKWMQSQLAQAV